MKWKTTAALVAVFAVFLGYVLIFQRGEPKKEMEVVRFNAERAAKIEVTYPGMDPARKPLVLEKREEDWYLAQPISALADKDTVDTMLERVSALQASSRISGEKASRLLKEEASEIGLDKPEVVIKVLDAKGRQLVQVSVGKKQLAGSDLYALANEQLITLSSWTVDDFKKEPADLRDKHLFHIKDEKDVEEVTLAYKDRSLGIKRAGEDEWALTKPVAAKARGWPCDDVVTKVKDLEINDFVEKPGADLAKYGLTDETKRIKITVRLKEGDPQTVLIGKKKADAAGDVAYAKAEGRADVVLITEQNVEDLTKEPMDLRETALVADISSMDAEQLTIKRTSGEFVLEKRDEDWFLVRPEEGKAEQSKVDDVLWDFVDLQAEKFVSEHPTDLKPFGLDKPQAEVTVRAKDGTATVYVGKRVGEEDLVYVRSSQMEAVAQANDDLLKHLPKAAKDILEKTQETESEDEGEEGESE